MALELKGEWIGQFPPFSREHCLGSVCAKESSFQLGILPPLLTATGEAVQNLFFHPFPPSADPSVLKMIR
jgi:hypothetical protein